MGNFLRIAFWIFLLGSFLLAKSFPISDFGAYYLRKHVECPEDSTFYAPRNVEKRCITAALHCVRRELRGAVHEECEDPREYVEDAVDYLDLLIKERSEKGHALTDSRECACERWPETSFREFVGEALTLLQLQHSDSSL